MKSSKYWGKRAAQRMYGYMQSAEEVAAEIEKAYIRAAKEIEADMKHIFDTFRGDMTEKQARNLLKNVERIDFDDLEKLYKKLPTGAEKDALLKQLNAPAYRARIARLQKLQDKLEQMVKTLYKVENTADTEHFRDLTKDAYYRATFDIQKGTGLGYSFTEISETKINKIISTNWTGANYSARIWNNTSALAEAVKQELLIGTMMGKSYRKMANAIEEKFSVGASQARRLIRTEANYIANQAEAESYKDAGIEKYQFLATLDNRTSPKCQELDNKVFPLSKRQVGVNYPPIHPWCRSTTVAVIDGTTLDGLKRRARDPETGKTYLVPADMSYEEWKRSVDEKKGAGTVDKSRKMLYNEKADKLQYEKYKSIFGDEMPKTFSGFQKLKYENKQSWDEYKARARTKNYLHEQLAYVYNGEKLFIPKHTKFDTIKTIAGSGTNTPIRIVDSLVKEYGGTPSEWKKRAGKITSGKYIFDVHWYERGEMQFDVKLKHRRESKK